MGPRNASTSTQNERALAAGGTRLATTRCGLARSSSAAKSSDEERSDTSARGRLFLREKARACPYIKGSRATRTRTTAGIRAPSGKNEVYAKRRTWRSLGASRTPIIAHPSVVAPHDARTRPDGTERRRGHSL